MADAQNFFETDTPHGLVKRIMYKKYLQAFIPITQQAKPLYGHQSYQTVIIDGFAGTGRYGDSWPEEIEQYGSPLIALMVALNFFYKKEHKTEKRWGKPSKVEYIDQITDLVDTLALDGTDSTEYCNSVVLIFVEKNKENFEKLKSNIANVLDDFFINPDVSYEEECSRNNSYSCYSFQIVHPKYPILCQIYNEEFKMFHGADELLSRPYVKCLTFLDPFGYSQIPFQAIETYLGKNKSVLINFMSSYVNRFLGDNEAVAKLYGIEGTSPPPPLKDFVKYLVRNFNKSGGETPTSNIDNCTAAYENVLKSVLSVEYTLSFEVRGKRNNILYHLIFATDRLKDIEIMKEAMNRCSQFEDALRMSDYTLVRNGSQLNLNNTQNNDSVADAIFKQFSGKRDVRIDVIKRFVLLETPFVFRKKVLGLMLEETDPRIVRVRDYSGSPPERKGSFPDRTVWLLTFKGVQEEEADEVDETVILADIIFDRFMGQDVHISQIKTYVSSFRQYRFKKRPLSIMEKEQNPRIANVRDWYGTYTKPRKKGTFPDHEDWLITFRMPIWVPCY